MATLHEYFNNNFPDLTLNREIPFDVQVGTENERVIVQEKVEHHRNTSARCVAYYVLESKHTFGICRTILENVQNFEHGNHGAEVIGSSTGDTLLGTHVTHYTNRVYLYCETALLDEEIRELNALANEKGLYVTLRSQDYVRKLTELEKPMAFVSHDSRDKELIAKRIADGLNSRLCPCWYDEYSLKVGDSLRASIEKGIKEAKKCIVVITPNFLSNEGWTKKEFDSIFTREMILTQRIVLPIWYGVRKEDVYEYSPSLVDTVALKWPDSSGDKQVYDKQVALLISKLHTEINNT